jgi:hypothetical protein
VEFLPDGGHAVACESGATMQRRPRRNHTPAFKAKVAPRAIERWLNWRSSLTSIPIRSHRGKRSSKELSPTLGDGRGQAAAA